jgi:hypothetical protein
MTSVATTQYRAFRRMHVKNDRFNQESWLDCWTELGRDGFTYEIVSERGSASLRDRVLRTLLRREQELVASGGAGRVELNEGNYEFVDGRSAGDARRSSSPESVEAARRDQRGWPAACFEEPRGRCQ